MLVRVVLADCYQGRGQETGVEFQQQQQSPRGIGFNLFTAQTLWKYERVGGSDSLFERISFGYEFIPPLGSSSSFVLDPAETSREIWLLVILLRNMSFRTHHEASQ